LSARSSIISYVQHFTTFPYLDLGIQHVVANSKFVQTFINNVYGVSAPVIQPFIPPCPQGISFEKKIDAIVLSPKGFPETNTAITNWLEQEKRVTRPINRLTHQPRDLLLENINQHRFFLTPVISEGFGMIPLEAMAMGTIPVGVDGYRNYRIC